MNFSLKPHQLVAHWVPGFVVLTMWMLADVHYANIHPSYIAYWSKINTLVGSSFSVLLAAIVPFVIGQVLDALRNLTEEWLDKMEKIEWLAEFKLDEKELNLFENTYFTYYVFSANLCIGLALGFLLILCLCIFPRDHGILFVAAVLAGILIFFFDAKSLRGDIKKILDKAAERKTNEKS
jgi:hypothetical protein